MSSFIFLAFNDELEKIARSARSESLELRPRPWDLGIHSKRTKQDNRGLAYGTGLGTAAALGAAAAAPKGALAGRSLFSLRKSKARAEAINQAISDTAKITRASSEAKARFYAAGGAEATRKAVRTKDLGAAADSGVEKGLRSAWKSLQGKGLGEIAARRGRAALKAGALGAGVVGGTKLLSNIGKYETARALTSNRKKKSGKTRMRLSKGSK
jgi:hypothetical protein